jgi:lipopolysaccharide transport system ATP-binding protein
MTDLAIRVENLGKQYRIGTQRARYKTIRESLTESLVAPFRRLRSTFQPSNLQPSNDEFIWALKDVSFDVKHGEVIGIIGRNGAGKSTLLKILSRITAPTEGRVEVFGRVGSLLEVGTGFHPELTGRENIYLNGAILGMKRAEIDRKFDEIVAFAEVEKFIDTPVKHYSSGMYVRLAFAVAAHLEPEILLVDEVLAVGDAAFQKKCIGKMGDVAKQGRTVLFVSHNTGAINKLCPQSLWLLRGELKDRGESHLITQHYLATCYSTAASKRFMPRADAKGYFLSARLFDDRDEMRSDFPSGTRPTVEVHFVLKENVRGCHVACIVTTSDGYHLFSTADTDTNPDLFGERLAGEYLCRVQLPTLSLNTGIYHISLGLGIPGVEPFDRQDALSFTIHDAGDFGTLKEGGRRAGLVLTEVPWRYLDSAGQ